MEVYAVPVQSFEDLMNRNEKIEETSNQLDQLETEQKKRFEQEITRSNSQREKVRDLEMSLKTKSYFKVAQMILALDEISTRGYNTSEAGEVLAQLSQRIRKSNKSLNKIYGEQATEKIGYFQSLIQRCIEE